MSADINLYTILNILPSAEAEVVRAAYRALALKYHPDVWKGDPTVAQLRMREINAAYEILSDEILRERYDASQGKDPHDTFDDEVADDISDDPDNGRQQDWKIATEYFPDLESILFDLNRTSRRLGFQFRTTLLETKKFSDRTALARQLEREFLRLYFGKDPIILDFARELVRSGNKIAAKELNTAVSVLGSDNTADAIISRIKERIRERETPERTAREIAAALVQTEHVSEAVSLIESLEGSISYKTTGWWIQSTKVIVKLRGHEMAFRSEREMVLWVLQNLAREVN